jgi:hypothetical protein
MSLPLGVYVSAVRDEKFHNRDAHSVERRAHERRIAPLMRI